MPRIATRPSANGTAEPAHLNPPERLRGDMQHWRPGMFRRPTLIERIFRRAG